jgi:hypothetical protein
MEDLLRRAAEYLQEARKLPRRTSPNRHRTEVDGETEAGDGGKI